jgi:hypothetical protein
VTTATSITALAVAALSLRLAAPSEGVGARVFATTAEAGRAVIQVQVMRTEKALAFGMPDTRIEVRLDGQRVAQVTTDAEGVAYAKVPAKPGPRKVQVLDENGLVLAEAIHVWEPAGACAEPASWPAERERPRATTMRVESAGSQALVIEVALLGDALAPTFSTRALLKVAESPSGLAVGGATVAIDAEGAALTPASLQTRPDGTALFTITPSYYSVVLRASVVTAGHATRFMASLPVAPAVGDVDVDSWLAPRTVVRGHARYATGHRGAYLEIFHGDALVHGVALSLEATGFGSAGAFVLPELDPGLYWLFLSTSANGAEAPPLTVRARPIVVGHDAGPLSLAFAQCGKPMPSDRDDALMHAPRPLVRRKAIADGLVSRGTVIRTRSMNAKRASIAALGVAIAFNLAVVFLLGRKARVSLEATIARSSRWGLAAGVALAALLLGVIASLIAGAD